MKLLYAGPVINAEMLVVMLEKHGITATQFADPDVPDEGDLSRPANVFVPEADYDRAHTLFYAERQDDLPLLPFCSSCCQNGFWCMLRAWLL